MPGARINTYATGRLAAALTASGDRVKIEPGQFARFIGGWSSDDFLYCAIRSAAHREIVRVNVGQSNIFQGLKIERGQDGDSARAWPAGSLIYQVLGAASLENILQQGEYREVAYNPNGVLAPLFFGEKVYQTDLALWWMAPAASGTEWRLVAGKMIVATPTISPEDGTYENFQKATLECTTPGSVIYYSFGIDGADPTEEATGIEYTEPFDLPYNSEVVLTVWAEHATDRWWTPSEEAEAEYLTYSEPAATPVITPAAGPYDNGQQVTIECASALADVHYTLDGSTPDKDSLLYEAPFYLPFDATTTVKARAVESPAGLWDNSEVAESTFVVTAIPTATPVIWPEDGEYSNGQWVEITCETLEAEIRYKLNGSGLILYEGPFTLPYNSTTTIEAIAVADELGLRADSETASAEFTTEIGPAFTPIIDPMRAFMNYENGGQEFSIIAILESDTRYTTDGSTPNAFSSIYDGPFTLPNNSLVTIRAYTPADPDGAWSDSDESSLCCRMGTIVGDNNSKAIVCRMTDSTAIAAWITLDTSNNRHDGSACVLSTSGGDGKDVSVSDSTVFDSDPVSSIKVCRLTDSKAIAVYSHEPSGGSYPDADLYACILTISDGEIVAGTPSLIVSKNVTWEFGVKYACALSETCVVLAYRTGTGVSGDDAACVLTISGDTISKGNDSVFDCHGKWATGQLVALTSTKALALYLYPSDPTYWEPHARILTVTDEGAGVFTVSAGDAIVIQESFTAEFLVGCRLSDEKALVCYSWDNRATRFCVLSVSGEVVEAGSVVSLSIGENETSDLDICAMGESSAMVVSISEGPFYCAENSTSRKHVISIQVEISGTTPSPSDAIAHGSGPETTGALYSSVCALSVSRALAVFNYHDSLADPFPYSYGMCMGAVLPYQLISYPAASGDDGHSENDGTVFNSDDEAIIVGDWETVFSPAVSGDDGYSSGDGADFNSDGDGVFVGASANLDISILFILASSAFTVTNIQFLSGGSWVQHLSDSDWAPFSEFGAWDSDHWASVEVPGMGHGIALVPIGSWATGFRPTKVKITHAASAPALNIINADMGEIAASEDYTSDSELDLIF